MAYAFPLGWFMLSILNAKKFQVSGLYSASYKTFSRHMQDENAYGVYAFVCTYYT